MVKHYGFKTKMNPVKNTYRLTIPDILVPIENPIGHLHRAGPVCFLKKRPRGARSLYSGSPIDHSGGCSWGPEIAQGDGGRPQTPAVGSGI